MHTPAETPLAIVGMSCRVPGADDLDGYWKLLTEGRTVLGDLPPERMDCSLYYDPNKGVHTKSYTTLGGYVPSRPFDAKNCPAPADLVDRTHKVHLNLLEVACAAARHAGYDPFHMPALTTGVYLGHTPPASIASRAIHARLAAHTSWYLKDVAGFDDLLGREADDTIRDMIQHFRGEFPKGHFADSLNANAYHGACLIAKAMGLDGPSMSYDAACASSMRALLHAARALQLGQIDMAFVGGASFTTMDTLILFSQAQSLTANKSRPFDADADGLVASEAYAVVLVKTLERALADGDKIQAVIRGIGVSSDGKGKSLWAPRPEGQIEAVRRAYPKDFSPARLQYIEAHATSTQLGDATELGALHTAIGDQLPAGKKLVVGSVKGNIGHSLETAGLASIVKTVLAMQHAQIPPQCGLENLNPDVAWDKVPFEVAKTLMPWPAPAPGQTKCAAVNAFGIGGLNVHVILEEHTAKNSQSLVKRIAGPAAKSVNVAKDGPLPLLEGVAIVGVGAVLPGARTAEALWDLFHAGTDMRIEAPDARWTGGPDKSVGGDSHWNTPTSIGGFITDFTYDWKKHKVPPKQVQFADPLQFMLLDATDQALNDAGYDKRPLDRARTGVVVGTVFGGEFSDQLQMGLRLPEFQRELRAVMLRRGVPEAECERVAAEFEKVLLKRMPALIDETGSFTASTLASRLTKTFDLMGGAVAVDSAAASSAAALSNCVDLLLAGDSDVMICASGQRHCGYAWFLSMNHNNALSQGAPTAPFDAASTGSVPGEGVGVFVLKRLSDAVRDGDRIHAIIRGIGAGHVKDVGESVSLAIRRGLKSAAIEPDQVSFIETSAGGVPDSDRSELLATMRAYDTPTRSEELYIGAVAGQIGHASGGSGMMSLLKAVTELGHVEVTKNVGLTRPIDELSRSALIRPAMTPQKLRGLNDDGKVYAAINSCSIWNGAYHILLEGPQRVAKSAPKPGTRSASQTPSKPVAAIAPSTAALSTAATSPWRIVRASGATCADVLAAVSAWSDAGKAATAYDAGATLISMSDEFSAAGPSRLSIVTKGAAELAELATLAAKQLSKTEARGALAEKGIFYAEAGTSRPRVAFLFPGQGSQYAGMLKALVEQFPAASDAMREVDEVLARLALPSFADVAWKDGDQLGNDVWRTQLSLLAADMIMFRAAEAMGLSPERVGGHSFGELVALTAANAWTFEDAVRATSARCAAIDACRNAKGALMSTSAPAHVADAACQELGGPGVGERVFVSHYNAPEQTVVGGDSAVVARVSEKLSAAGYRTKILDVPAAFHTPLMEEVKEPFGRALATIPLDPPRLPLLSSVTNKYVADPIDVRDNLVVQMTQPVAWVELVKRLHAEGMNVFVEVGPKQVLTGLGKQILAGADVTFAACDHAKRDGLQQLLFARAAVEVTGALDAATLVPPLRKGGPGGVAIESGDSQSLTASNAPPSKAPAAKTVDDSLPPQRHPSPPPAPPSEGRERRVEVHGDTRVLRLAGAPYEMGRQHGVAESDNIRRVLRRYADLVGTRWEKLPGVDAAIAMSDSLFGRAELEELRGIADGAGVALPALIAHNVRLHLDVGSGGLHFAVKAGSNPGAGLLHGVNEDLQRGLAVRDCLSRNVQIRTPQDGLAHVSFCVAGQVGTLNGLNSAGLAVTTTALLDCSPSDAPAGPLHTILVKQLLEQATDVDSAILLLRKLKSTGAWTLCLSHQSSDRLCYVEFDGKDLKVQAAPDAVLASNHRLMRAHLAAEGEQTAGAPAHSKHRLNRLKELLGAGPNPGENPGPVSIEAAQSALRDRFDPSRGRETDYPTINTVRRVDNQISILIQPAEKRVWVTGGPLSNGHQNQFQCLDLKTLLPSFGADSPTPRHATRSNGAPPNSGGTNASPNLPSIISRRDLASAYQQAKSDLGTKGDVCNRSILRAVAAPLPANPTATALEGSIIVYGANSASDAITAKLRSRGADVITLKPAAGATIESLLAELDAVTQSAPHLVIATAFDADAVTDDARWNDRRDRGAMTPFFVAQKWFQRIVDAKLLDKATITAVTTMGGDFGVSGHFASVESGALSGLVKGLEMEVRLSRGAPNFRGRVVDFAASVPANAVAEAVVREMTAGDAENEIGYIEGRRYAARPVPAAVESSPHAPHEEGRARTTRTTNTNAPRATGSLHAEREGYFEGSRAPQPGAVFVITGGARGVTAVVARELGKRFGVKLHLIGASPKPEVPEAWRNLAEGDLKEVKATVMKEALANGQKPADAWGRFEKALEIDKTLREFEQSGLQTTYHACDVSNRAALAALLDTIRKADGPIDGVIHGAGFERATRFEKKQRDLVDRTIAAKVDGAFHLMELTQNDPVKWFAGFGSVSGRFGGVGQADYSVANEMLAKLIDWHRARRPDCGSAVFHWHAWDDVGMAVRPESQHIRKLHNIKFMPSLEGARHLLDELAAGLPEPEVVITELDYAIQRYGASLEACEEPADLESGNGTALPLIDRVVEQTAIGLVAEIDLDPTRDVFLIQHLYKKRPILPIVASMEGLAEVAEACTGKRVVAIRDIEISTGLRFPTDDLQTARLHARAEGNSVVCDLTCDLKNRKGQVIQKDRPYLRGTVDVADSLEPINLQQPDVPGPWHEAWYPEEENVLWHGPVYRLLRQMTSWGEAGCASTLVAPEPDCLAPNRAGRHWLTPAALLDACFYASGVLLWHRHRGVVTIPDGIASIRFGELPQPGERCTVYIADKGRDAKYATFDFWLFGRDGRVILAVEGYRNVIVAEEPAHAV